MTALALHAGAAAQTGSVSAAETLYELLEPWANQVIYTGVLGYGHARMYLGQLDQVLGRDELAVEHLEFACRFHEEHGLLLWAAESHLWLAQALTRRFDVDRARTHAERALELAQKHGYGVVERRAAAVLDRAAIDDRANNANR